MEAEAAGRNVEAPVAPHTLDPESLLAAHLAPFLNAQHDSIMAQLAEVQAANQDLFEQIQAQRAEMLHLLEGLANVVGDVEGSAGLMRGNDVQNLTGEVRAIETRLRG
jgi:kinetochore protein NNF1